MIIIKHVVQIKCIIRISVTLGHTHTLFFLSLVTVSGLKPEDVPELRMEAEERHNAAYEVHHQKLVHTRVHNEIFT